MPSEEISAVWQTKMETNSYACRGFLKLSSDYFREVADVVENHEAYIEFADQMRYWGIDMDAFMENLKYSLWESSTCRE